MPVFKQRLWESVLISVADLLKPLVNSFLISSPSLRKSLVCRHTEASVLSWQTFTQYKLLTLMAPKTTVELRCQVQSARALAIAFLRHIAQRKQLSIDGLRKLVCRKLLFIFLLYL